MNTTGNGQPIKLLIVDDSAFYRQAIANAFANHPRIKVVGKACDAFEARDKILELNPDVMTLDVEMPRMSGIEFLRILMPQRPMRVVVASSLNGIVFEAMHAGAVDFVEKPSTAGAQQMNAFSREIVEKVGIAANATLQRQPGTRISQQPAATEDEHFGKGLIALGASTGGTEATSVILKKLPRNIPGMVITQHMPPVFTKLYAQRLDKECLVTVSEACDMDIVRQGHVYIAPGDQHLTVEKKGNDVMIRLKQGEKVNGHCPSVDVMFQSVAKIADANTIGIILTGMGADGAQGLLEMKEKGAYTIGQNEATCVVYGMPMVAQKLGAVTLQAPIERIADVLVSQLRKRKNLP